MGANQTGLSDILPSNEAIALAGPTLFGLTASGVGFGLFVTQAAIYWVLFPLDNWARKTLVGLLSFVSLYNMATNLAYAWNIFVNGFQGLGGNLFTGFTLASNLAANLAASLLSQLFFAHRAWSVLHRPIWLALLELTAIGTYAGVSLLLVVLSGQQGGVMTNPMEYWLVAELGLSSANDVFLAIVLARHLKSQRTEFEDTNLILKRILEQAVTTGSLSAAITLLNAGMTVWNVRNAQVTASVGILLFFPQFVVCLVVATLNTRRLLQRQRSGSSATHPSSAVKIDTNVSLVGSKSSPPSTGTPQAYYPPIMFQTVQTVSEEVGRPYHAHTRDRAANASSPVRGPRFATVADDDDEKAYSQYSYA